MSPRPRLPEDQKRRRRVYARLTDAEFQRLKGMADAAAMPVSEYVRETVLNGRPKPRPRRSRTIEQAMTELQRIATNFQQLADATGDTAFGEWAEWVGSEVAEALLPREDLMDLIAAQLETINTAGQVVNALARRANSGDAVPAAEVDRACEAVETALQPLLEALAGDAGGAADGDGARCRREVGAMRFKVPNQQPTGFRRLAHYLAGRSRETTPGRVEWMEARNLQSRDPDVASRAMAGTAAQSRRCKQPAYHFVLSFDPNDDATGRLDDGKTREIADETIRRMGLQEHQALIYAHRDKRHRHIHFLVNRVHPETGRAYSRHNDGQRLHGLGRRIARERGLNVAREPERARDRQRVDNFDRLPSGTRVDDLDGPPDAQQEREEAPRGRVPEGDHWQARREGREPEPRFPQHEITKLRQELRPAFNNARSWDDISTELAERGLFLMPKGQGLVVSDGERTMKLSDLGKNARLKRFEQRFGERYVSFAAREARRLHATEDRNPHETVAERANRKPTALLDEADKDCLRAKALERAYRRTGRQARHRAKHRSQLSRRHARDRQRKQDTQAQLYRALQSTYRSPRTAHKRWRRLEKTHGREEAAQLVRQYPAILGQRRSASGTGQQLRSTPMQVHILLDRRRQWHYIRDRLHRTRRELERARERFERARRDYRMVARFAGTPDAVRNLMRAKLRARARALERVSERMVREAKIADRRKAVLMRAVRGYKRHRERERRRNRGRGRDL